MRVPAPDVSVWIDGRKARCDEAGIPLDDPACHVGLGVFETIAVREGRILELTEHLARLGGGAALMGVPLPADERMRATLTEAAADASPLGWLKVIATRGGHWYVLTGILDPDAEPETASAVILPWRRNPRDPLAGVKTISYAANELGLEEAARRGADEGLWLNTLGLLAEGCTSNVFVVHRRKLFTPGTEQGILPGVVRGIVLQSARRIGLTVHEGKVRIERLRHATEAFLTSSLRGVRPLVELEGRPVGSGRVGTVTLEIARKVRRVRGLSGDPVSDAGRPGPSGVH